MLGLNLNHGSKRGHRSILQVLGKRWRPLSPAGEVDALGRGRHVTYVILQHMIPHWSLKQIDYFAVFYVRLWLHCIYRLHVFIYSMLNMFTIT